MEYEVSSSIRIGVALILMSIVISLVMYTVSMGNSFANQSYSEGAMIVDRVENAQLKSLCYETDVVMPMAAIYSIVSQEHTNISELYFKAAGTSREKDFAIKFIDESWTKIKTLDNTTITTGVSISSLLEEHLSGKVIVNVKKNEDSTYTIDLAEVRS